MSVIQVRDKIYDTSELKEKAIHIYNANRLLGINDEDIYIDDMIVYINEDYDIAVQTKEITFIKCECKDIIFHCDRAIVKCQEVFGLKCYDKLIFDTPVSKAYVEFAANKVDINVSRKIGYYIVIPDGNNAGSQPIRIASNGRAVYNSINYVIKPTPLNDCVEVMVMDKNKNLVSEFDVYYKEEN